MLNEKQVIQLSKFIDETGGFVEFTRMNERLARGEKLKRDAIKKRIIRGRKQKQAIRQ